MKKSLLIFGIILVFVSALSAVHALKLKDILDILPVPTEEEEQSDGTKQASGETEKEDEIGGIVTGIAFIKNGSVCFVEPDKPGEYKIIAQDIIADEYSESVFISSDGKSICHKRPENVTHVYYPATGKEFAYGIYENGGAVFYTSDIFSVSPDGSAMLVSPNRISIDPKESSRIIDNPVTSESVIWSSDSKKIFYLSGEKSYVQLVTGGNQKITDVFVRPLCFGGDNNSVYYERNNALYKSDLRGNVEKIASLSNDMYITVASSKSELIYGYYDMQNSTVLLKSVVSDKKISKKLGRPISSVYASSISPDEKYMYFATQCDDLGDLDCIYVVNMDTMSMSIVACGRPLGWIRINTQYLKDTARVKVDSEYVPDEFTVRGKIKADLDGDGADEVAYVSENTIPSMSTNAITSFIWAEKDGKLIAYDKRTNFNNGTDESNNILGLDYVKSVSIPDGRQLILVSYKNSDFDFQNAVLVYELNGNRFSVVLNARYCGECKITDSGSIIIFDIEGNPIKYIWNGKKFVTEN